MPFSFSHPALVLPLTYFPKKWYSLTGLIIGSLTPDFEYFIRMKVQSIHGHTLLGLFYFNLPLGILLAYIFHNLVRDSLYINLPGFIKARLTQFQKFDWNRYFFKNWIVVSVSVIIGAASHLLWDGFTHKFGYFVEIIPSLEYKIQLLGHHFPMYKVLQHFSTLLGGLILFYSFFKLPNNLCEENSIDLKYWITLIVIALIILGIRVLTGLNIRLIGQVIVTMISASLISVIVTPILIRKI